MDFDLDLNSENCTMNSFLELEKEIEEVPFFPDSVVRPSVIVKPRPKPASVQPSLTDIMSSWRNSSSKPKENRPLLRMTLSPVNPCVWRI